jgi:hypothetical protein
MNSPATHLTFYGMSDTGLRRPYNEDHFVVVDLTQKEFAAKDNKVISPPRTTLWGAITLWPLQMGLGIRENSPVRSLSRRPLQRYGLWRQLNRFQPAH